MGKNKKDVEEILKRVNGCKIKVGITVRDTQCYLSSNMEIDKSVIAIDYHGILITSKRDKTSKVELRYKDLLDIRCREDFAYSGITYIYRNSEVTILV